MAIDLCSETSTRISFSNDLCQTDVPIEQKSRSDSSLLDSNSEFVFCVSNSFEHESSSADELFSDGIILPIHIRERTDDTSKQVHKSEAPPHALLPHLPVPSNIAKNSKKESLKEVGVTSFETDERPQSSKSFWRFKRSTSLNCDNRNMRSLICPLPLLSRSNSTGSVPSPKRATSSKERQASQKQPPSVSSMARSSSSPSSFYYPISQKPSLKKNYGGCYGNGISPVLNVPVPDLSKGTANLFGLCSLFRNGKDKKGKK